MDAFNTGWGAYCNGILTGGCWSVEEKTLHINALELVAAMFGVQAFCKHNQVTSMLLKTDNTTVVAYVNKMGGNMVPDSGATSKRAVGVVPPEEDSCQSSASARKTQFQCRFPLLPPPGSVRLDSRPRDLQHDRSEVGSFECRPVCDQILNSPTLICQLATRPYGRGNRCFSPRLDSDQGLCSPSMVPYLESPQQGSGPSSNVGRCSSLVANTGLVPSTDEYARG